MEPENVVVEYILGICVDGSGGSKNRREAR
jgi:hypothetical protein